MISEDGALKPAPDSIRLFAATCDIIRSGYTTDEARTMLREITGHLDAKDLRTIKSAVDEVQGKKS